MSNVADMSGELAGKRGLVTGAGAGIGRGLALQLASQGVEVWAVSRTQANLDTLQAECPALHCVQVIHG